MDEGESREEDGGLDEEELKKLEEERQQALQQAREAESKAQAKAEFRKKNLEARGSQPSPETLRKLDGSVKKNSAFVKKLKNITEQQRDSLVSDFNSLNLTKYIQEVATSIAEAKLKLSDVGCAVHLCSLLHCRYGDFSDLLLEQLQKIYSAGISKDEDKSAAITKYRLGLRLLGELVLAGIVEQDIGQSLLTDMLNAVVAADRQHHSFLTVVLSFCRQSAEDFAGIIPRRIKLLQTKHGIVLPQCRLIPADRQSMFREILCQYFKSVKKYLTHEHKEMQARARKNRTIIQSKGELSVERTEENDKAQKAYDKLLTTTSTLGDILDLDMPDLPEDDFPTEQTEISIDIQLPSIASEAEFDSFSLWEDEEQRSFYEDITDIRPLVPAILFEGKRVKSESESSDTSSTDEVKDSKSAETELDEEMDDEALLEKVIKDTEQMVILDVEEEEELMAEGDESVKRKDESSQPTEEKLSGEEAATAAVLSMQDSSSVSSSSGLLDELLGRLPTVMNRKFIDEVAVEFCLRLNTKMNRQKLVKTLFNVDRNRMDLIPFYSRLVATLAPCLPDIPVMLVDTIVRDFRHQLRKKDQTHVHTKLKNARFIAELTKFNVCPKPEAMRCITLTLQEFTHHNVDLACTCIEHCGRYLLRSPDSNLRARALMEIMIRKKRVQHLDGRQKSLVENALYAANPPVVQAVVREPLPPLQAYIHKLLHKDLNKNSIEKVLKQFRKLNWSDPKVFLWAVCALAEIWNVKYSNIHLVADLLAGLRGYQEEAVIQVVDAVLEDVRLGLETSLPQLNRRRVAIVKYLGELYNYQLVEAGVIFRTLYAFISFGSNPDGSPSAIDPYDSYFRVRLVCGLLDTCGEYFDFGSAKKKLDNFFVFFQCYVFSKRQPLPLEVEHLITDTIGALRPNLSLYTTATEAVEAATELEKKFRNRLGDSGTDNDGGEESDEEEATSEHGGSVEEEEREYEQEEEEEDVEGEDGEDLDELTGPEEQYDDEVAPVLKSGPKLITCQEDDEFQAQLDRIMNESRRTDTSAKVPAVDVAIPMNLRSAGGKSQPVETVVYDGQQRIKFKLVTKKGHKQQLKDLAVPFESSLTTGLLDNQRALKDEHQEMKKLVLHYESRQEDEDQKTVLTPIRQPPPPPLVPTQRSIQQPFSSHAHNRRQRTHHQPRRHVETKAERPK